MTDQKPFLFDIPSVTELTGKIKTVLEQNFMDILVEGEASNVKRSANGHFYFTLKDSGAQLPCVIWRSTVQRLGIDLTDGQQIVIGGDIQVYEPHGRYQMIVNLVQQAGIGKLALPISSKNRSSDFKNYSSFSGYQSYSSKKMASS